MLGSGVFGRRADRDRGRRAQQRAQHNTGFEIRHLHLE
jgi:hypothetical protein